jgi:membrane protease YdiL (CAAX protease family)
MKLPASVSGWHIAFFILALNYISIPLARKLLALLGPGWDEQSISRTVIFALGAILIAAFPAARRLAADSLRRPIPNDRRLEVAWVTLGNALLFPLAFAGALAAWDLWLNGAPHLQAALAEHKPVDAELARAFSRSGIFLLLAGTLAAPVLEELVFRGFLFSAWERRWGWAWAAVLTSTTFAIYHPHFGGAFVESMIFICALRRTGSLAAPITVHAIYNLMLWYPLLGQYMFPRVPKDDVLSTWGLQFSALGIALVALPIYVWLAAAKPAGEKAAPAQENRIPA